METITKICTRCKLEKSINEFGKHKQGKDGLRSTCKQCHREQNQEYKHSEKGIECRKRYKRSEAGKAASKRYRENHKEEIKAYIRTEEYRQRKRVELNKNRFGGNREKALERDGHRCTVCGSDYLLQVHHKDELGRNKPKEVMNNDLENLITLCARCHIKQHNPVFKRWNKVKEEVV